MHEMGSEIKVLHGENVAVAVESTQMIEKWNTETLGALFIGCQYFKNLYT